MKENILTLQNQHRRVNLVLIAMIMSFLLGEFPTHIASRSSAVSLFFPSEPHLFDSIPFRSVARIKLRLFFNFICLFVYFLRYCLFWFLYFVVYPFYLLYILFFFFFFAPERECTRLCTFFCVFSMRYRV